MFLSTFVERERKSEECREREEWPAVRGQCAQDQGWEAAAIYRQVAVCMLGINPRYAEDKVAWDKDGQSQWTWLSFVQSY